MRRLVCISQALYCNRRNAADAWVLRCFNCINLTFFFLFHLPSWLCIILWYIDDGGGGGGGGGGDDDDDDDDDDGGDGGGGGVGDDAGAAAADDDDYDDRTLNLPRNFFFMSTGNSKNTSQKFLMTGW